jgi:hypothetical protein
MFGRFKISGLVGSVLWLALMGNANAGYTFTSVGQSATVVYSYLVDGAQLDATVLYKLTGYTSNTAVFDVTISNNTLVSATNTNVLMSVGIQVVTPTLVSVVDDSSMFDTAINTVLPSFHKVDFCAFAANGCAGGNVNKGLGENLSSGPFSTTMTFAAGAFSSGVDVSFGDPFSVKYQSVGVSGKSWEFSGCVQGDTTCTTRPPQEVPEPGMLGLLGLGLLGIGATRRRRVQA